MRILATNLSLWHGRRLMETADPAHWRAFLYWSRVADFWKRAGR